MPEEQLNDLIQPFYRLRQRTDSQQGAGLGLAICQAVVKSHGGGMALRARPAGGLSVTVRLPQICEPPPGRN